MTLQVKTCMNTSFCCWCLLLNSSTETLLSCSRVTTCAMSARSVALRARSCLQECRMSPPGSGDLELAAAEFARSCSACANAGSSERRMSRVRASTPASAWSSSRRLRLSLYTMLWLRSLSTKFFKSSPWGKAPPIAVWSWRSFSWIYNIYIKILLTGYSKLRLYNGL